MTRQFDRVTSIFFFIALAATGIALGGALAHLFEMPNKMGMNEAAYFATQEAYRGWWMLAFVLLAQVIGLIGLVVRTRGRFADFLPACTALGALIVAQVVFWVYTAPANAATAQWTERPAGWEALRLQWEYSHAVGAVCQLVAFFCLCLMAARALGWMDPGEPGQDRP